MATAGSDVLACAGVSSACITYKWPDAVAISYGCGTSRTTVTVEFPETSSDTSATGTRKTDETSEAPGTTQTDVPGDFHSETGRTSRPRSESARAWDPASLGSCFWPSSSSSAVGGLRDESPALLIRVRVQYKVLQSDRPFWALCPSSPGSGQAGLDS
ncbi:uncharacterized protein F5Z01DRAFT_748303 [Emericellopsis atlantica]|uniref:Uncharacterized protein n=1 Tax=Emericellopsis atlantica TaxID=2614577 RepID=A0A9P7ZRW9_9HYPO|nr:uncharacterized protein F5Z01DRAFT_748303 [Emericellopsis atlantica]KAG9256686.1 hypothetical protein F5Z01DRAFT_748303 [Emericellopsis atlantica]